MQQVMPTPKLPSNIAFYKRKMFTLNFGIHAYKRNQGYMFVWDEVTANRGANEIASCIYKFINNHINFKAERCGNQNNNLSYIHIAEHPFTIRCTILLWLRNHGEN